MRKQKIELIINDNAQTLQNLLVEKRLSLEEALESSVDAFAMQPLTRSPPHYIDDIISDANRT